MAEQSISWRHPLRGTDLRNTLPEDAVVVFQLAYGQIECRNMGTYLDIQHTYNGEYGRLTVEPRSNDSLRIRVEKE